MTDPVPAAYSRRLEVILLHRTVPSSGEEIMRLTARVFGIAGIYFAILSGCSSEDPQGDSDPSDDVLGEEDEALTSSKQPSGACLVRGSGGLPSASAASVGKGYAKKMIRGVDDIGGLQAKCSLKIYNSLVKKFCTKNSGSAQLEVLTYSATGSPSSTACSGIGCGAVSCR